MSIIRLENIYKSFAGAPVLEGIDFRVEEGEHIGLIGRNGTGKSTLFRLITGELVPESGTVDRMKRASVACLAQLPKVDPHVTIYDIVLDSFSELLEKEKALTDLEHRIAEGDDSLLEEYGHLQEAFTLSGGYEFRTRIKQVLQGLGFSVEEFGLSFQALSGGQRTRLMLALVLLKDADLLLLDEPENHLDLEAREWLESYIRESRQSVVIISHDRQMLNSVVDRIVELERGQFVNYTGNYEGYLKQKELRQEQQQKAFERQQEFIRKEEAWIDRFRYKSTKARQVQSRIKQLEKLEVVDAPMAESAAMKLDLGEVVRSGAVVLEARSLSMAYDGLTLYKDVSFQVERGERIGIVGPNGSGKTTLLRQLAGQLSSGNGEVKLGHKAQLRFYEQNHENLNPSNDILTEALETKPEWTPEQIRSFLGRFLFVGEDVFKPVSALSGGELSRVAMAKLVLSKANILLLDEPTNHLDIASREALESALVNFPGTLIIASHDRALIDRLSERLIIVENSQATMHLGNYSHYRWKNKSAEEERKKNADEVLAIRRQKTERKNKREEKKNLERERRKQQRQLEQIESEIAELEEEVGTYDAKFAAVDPADYQAAQTLKTEYDALQLQLQKAYTRWETMCE